MSYTSLLIDICDIYEFTDGVADGYGIKAKTWAIKTGLGDSPCRLSRAIRGTGGVGGELEIGAEVVIAPYTLFLGDVDITEQDRVILDSITYEVLLVQNKADHTGDHHKECWVRTVR